MEVWELVEDLYPGFEGEMRRVEEVLLESIPQSTPGELYSASRHLIAAKGKRIRPALVLLSFRAVNPEGELEGVLPIAAGIELIHTATIIHDDIIDLAVMRRGVESVNAKWGNHIALLAGDLIFATAFGLIGSHPMGELSRVVSQACRQLAEGEVLETLHTGNASITEEVYLEIVERKTASLFWASAKCGALAGGGRREEVEALGSFGYLLGIGFQMTDDLLDVVAGEKVLGKKVGMDISSGKPTFMVLHALRNTSGERRRELEEMLKKGSVDVDRVLEILQSAGSIEYAKRRAEHFIRRALARLDGIRDTRAKQALRAIAEYAILREF